MSHLSTDLFSKQRLYSILGRDYFEESITSKGDLIISYKYAFKPPVFYNYFKLVYYEGEIKINA